MGGMKKKGNKRRAPKKRRQKEKAPKGSSAAQLISDLLHQADIDRRTGQRAYDRLLRKVNGWR